REFRTQDTKQIVLVEEVARTPFEKLAIDRNDPLEGVAHDRKNVLVWRRRALREKLIRHRIDLLSAEGGNIELRKALVQHRPAQRCTGSLRHADIAPPPVRECQMSTLPT